MVIVTEIEVHHVECEFHDWLQYVLSHYHERSDRTICESLPPTGPAPPCAPQKTPAGPTTRSSD